MYTQEYAKIPRRFQLAQAENAGNSPVVGRVGGGGDQDYVSITLMLNIKRNIYTMLQNNVNFRIRKYLAGFSNKNTNYS